jgi:hypothetical protein
MYLRSSNKLGYKMKHSRTTYPWNITTKMDGEKEERRSQSLFYIYILEILIYILPAGTKGPNCLYIYIYINPNY